MKHKSKLLAVLLAVAALLAALSLTLVACGKDEEQTQNQTQNQPQTQLPPHEHSYTLVEAKAPTCTEDGNISYYTCDCGKFFDSDKQEIEESQITIPSTGHDKVTTSWESDGTSHWHKCNNCDAKLDLSSHATADEWIEDSAATCTAKAHHHKECPVCDYHIAEEDYGNLADHELGEWIEDNEATCTKQAHHHKECANCDYTQEEDYGELASHELGEWIEDSGATCTMQAHHHKECANCDYTQEEDYGELASHELGEWIEDSGATCTKQAHHHKECANCDYTLEDDYGELASHELGEWIDDNEPSCTARGHHHKECANCDYTQEEDYGELASHDLGEWIIDGDYKCGDTVTRHKDCANCEYSIVDDKYVVPHTWKEQLTEDKQKECSRCGYKELVYEERAGKIYFGEYPQTQETDNGITATLAQMSGDRPVKGSSGKWTDYKYYINGEATEYMWYIDIEYNGARYRGVYFTSYRPYYTTDGSSTGNTYQDDNGYYTNALYWFKWEPIEWRVLERTDGEAFLMSNVILDCQQYYRTDSGTRRIDGKTVYPNNYKESDIRAWLNGTFYEWAFDELDQSIIKTTLVDNSASTTSSSSNSYACENTNDKVFLLSYKDVLNTSYGFNSSSGNYDTARRLKTTGYAQSQGAYTSTDSSYRGNGCWWLRSPDRDTSSNALGVGRDGRAGYSYYVGNTSGGVVPAIKIAL